MTALKKIVFQGEPGANSHLALHEVFPDHEAVPCATFEDAFAAIAAALRMLGMIPIENSVAGRVADIHHLMPDFGAAHRCRAFHAGASPVAGAERRDAQGHQDGREPRPCARPMPQDHPQARHQAGGGGRHRGLRARGRRSGRQDARGHRHPACRRNLRARYSRRGHRGRGAQYDALHRAVARARAGRRTTAGR